jgi:hypothetical protein
MEVTDIFEGEQLLSGEPDRKCALDRYDKINMGERVPPIDIICRHIRPYLNVIIFKDSPENQI